MTVLALDLPREQSREATAGAEADILSTPEAARQIASLAASISASSFALFLVNRSREERKAVPVLDEAYPEFTEATKSLATRLSPQLLHRVCASTTPLWWTSDPVCAAAFALRGLAWANETDACLPASTALCLPVHSDAGKQGLVVFLGTGMAMDDRTLCELHSRCFAIFAAVIRFRAVEGGKLPAMSKRELECLKLTANGHTSEDIAARLGLSVHTANQYLTNAAQKLNVVNRMHAVAKALRLGLID